MIPQKKWHVGTSPNYCRLVYSIVYAQYNAQCRNRAKTRKQMKYFYFLFLASLKKTSQLFSAWFFFEPPLLQTVFWTGKLNQPVQSPLRFISARVHLYQYYGLTVMNMFTRPEIEGCLQCSSPLHYKRVHPWRLSKKDLNFEGYGVGRTDLVQFMT